MILIADSGSTKTDWCLADPHSTTVFRTQGLNPFFLSSDEIAEIVSKDLLPQLPQVEVTEVYFYGAGCTPEKAPIIVDALTRHFHCEVHAHSDMLGAARALCGNQPGIACILGTGANSCLYDGRDICANVSPLGYILGDEGSGAVIGKIFVGDLLKNQLSEGLKEKFLSEYDLDLATIIDRVYRQPLPNRFLASFAPFIRKHLDVPEVRALVLNAFDSFIRRNVLQYEGASELPIHFVGSIARHFEEVLAEAVRSSRLTMGRILTAPVEGLREYHYTAQ